MDLRYSDSDEKFRAELRAWLGRHVPGHGVAPPPEAWAERRAYDTSWQRKLYDAGYAGIHWPEAYGGRGASLTEQLIYYEETTRARAPYIGANFIGLMHGGPTLIAEGTEEQKRFHLPRILRGEEVWCQGFSEPVAGSDLAALRTRAVREGDEYVIEGQKIWSTRAQMADYCELLVRTDPNAPKHRGLTWIIMPMRLPGVEIRPLSTLEGEGEFSQIFFEGARVPVENRVGEENDGWRVANVTLRFERGTAFGAHIAQLQDYMAELAAVARRVRRHETAAWEDRELRREVGRLQGEVDALWALVKLSISEAGESGVPPVSGSAVKLFYTEIAQRIAETGVRLLGRAGLCRSNVAGLPSERMLHNMLWSLSMTIAAGTSQIQRNIISERVLGMPKDR